jgi:hypothetical protein
MCGIVCYIALQDHRGQQWAADAGAVPKPAASSNSSQHCADAIQVCCRLLPSDKYANMHSTVTFDALCFGSTQATRCTCYSVTAMLN